MSIPPRTVFGNWCVKSICHVSDNNSNLSSDLCGVMETFDSEREDKAGQAASQCEHREGWQNTVRSDFKCFSVYGS